MITYNNINYFFNNNDSINKLLQRSDFESLPIEGWKELLIAKDGIVDAGLLQHILLYKINQYDESNEVNSFFYKDNQYWLDKSTRVGLQNLLTCSDGNLQLALGDNIIELSHDKAKDFLNQLELYSAKSYINTHKHINNVKQLHTVEDIINYEYTCGYPEKLTLNE